MGFLIDCRNNQPAHETHQGSQEHGRSRAHQLATRRFIATHLFIVKIRGPTAALHPSTIAYYAGKTVVVAFFRETEPTNCALTACRCSCFSVI